MKTYRQFMEGKSKDIPSTAKPPTPSASSSGGGTSSSMGKFYTSMMGDKMKSMLPSGGITMAHPDGRSAGIKIGGPPPSGGAAPGGNQGMSNYNQSTSKRVGNTTSTALPSSKIKARPKNLSTPSTRNVSGKKRD